MLPIKILATILVCVFICGCSGPAIQQAVITNPLPMVNKPASTYEVLVGKMSSHSLTVDKAKIHCVISDALSIPITITGIAKKFKVEETECSYTNEGYIPNKDVQIEFPKDTIDTGAEIQLVITPSKPNFGKEEIWIAVRPTEANLIQEVLVIRLLLESAS